MGKYKTFKGDIDIFIDENEREKYLEKHDIKLDYLENGILLAGANRYFKDSVGAEVNLVFPSGTYYEPKDKQGITHFIEHLISNKPGIIARYNDAYYNAGTSEKGFEIHTSGAASIDIKDYGIWPGLPEIIRNSSSFPDISDAAIESEKGVIIGEIHERLADPKLTLRKLYGQIVYDKENPYTYEVCGTEEFVRNITIEDLRKFYSEIFIPRGMEITVYTEANKEIIDYALNFVKDHVVGIEDKGKEPLRVDDELYGKLNPNFKQGGVYIKDSGLKDKILEVSFVWLLPSIPYTAQNFAISRFCDVAEQKLFKLFRERGIGYSTQLFNTPLGDNSRLIGFELVIPKVQGPAEYAKSLIKLIHESIIDDFSDEDIQYISDITEKRMTAVPVNVNGRFYDVLYGLRNYGKIIDTDKVIEINKMVTPEHLRSIKKLFLRIDPSIVIIGDVN